MKLNEYQHQLQLYKMQIQALEKLRKQQATIESQIKHAEVDMEQYEQNLKNILVILIPLSYYLTFNHIIAFRLL